MGELPYLKKKMGGGGPAVISRAPDDGADDESLLNSVASELLDAIEKKNIKGLRDALKALVLHIQDEDKEQDQGE
jgi:hypothetical protein